MDNGSGVRRGPTWASLRLVFPKRLVFQWWVEDWHYSPDGTWLSFSVSRSTPSGWHLFRVSVQR